MAGILCAGEAALEHASIRSVFAKAAQRLIGAFNGATFAKSRLGAGIL
jgi:hypothetical protein